MESIYGLVVFIHVICASALTLTLIIMQLVIGPALEQLPDGEQKQAVTSVIQGRWHPVVDVVILLLTLTALYLLVAQWRLIGTTPILHIKVTFGIITLVCVNGLHFYFRGFKRKLKAEGKIERLKDITRLTRLMEKTALIFGPLTFLVGVLFNHSPF
jgi:hypothetical protein